MKIAQDTDVRIGIMDIETMFELFDIGIYNPDTKEWSEFQISAYKNELYEFVKWYTSNPVDYLVGFNNIGFDQQVLEYIIVNHQKWYDLTGLQIAKLISNYAQKVIENSRYGLYPDYKEHQFTIKPIDVFLIHHLNNEAKMTSLKWCEFMMNMDVEEMPIHFSKSGLSREDVEVTQEYRRHDVMATLALLYLTLGQVSKIPELTGVPLEELMDYEGKNKIQDRVDIQKETGMLCINWNDVKIGEEWNKRDYLKSENILDEKSIYPQKVKHPYGQKFKNFFPKTMKFRTEKLKKFVKEMGDQFVLAEKQEFPITIGNTTYTFAKGGIHSTERNRRTIVPKGYMCTDADVGAQYPNSIIKLEIFPPHLKRTILTNFVGKVAKKDHYKQVAKKLIEEGKKEEAIPFKGLEGGAKYALNGGYYGKLGQKGSFLEYPEGLLKVCVSNQIEILMLIEIMEEVGFQVISGNTDGIVTIYPEEKREQYLTICKEWEVLVGNNVMGKLEYADIKGFWQDSVNSYIAQIVDEKGKVKVKKKGRFVTVYGNPGCEINKNKSARIIPLALEAYFVEGKDPQEFIKGHKNIFDFCIAKKASGKMHYEEQLTDETGITKKVHKKLVRFFLSKKGSVLWKRGINNMGKPMNNHVNAPNELGQPLITYFNKFFDSKDYQIDYNQYILETLERIDNIEHTKKAKAFADSLRPTQQLSLF